MRRIPAFAPAFLAVLSLAVATAAAGEENYGGLPPGPGQEETFFTCSGCHSIRLVVQQRLDRDFWDETLVYMVGEQGMDEIDPEERALILDYLATYLSDTTPR